MKQTTLDRRIDPILDSPIRFALTPAGQAAPPARWAAFGDVAYLEDVCDCGALRGEHAAEAPHGMEHTDPPHTCGGFRLLGGPLSLHYQGKAERPSGPQIAHAAGCTCPRHSATAEEAFGAVRRALVSLGVREADVSIQHTGGNVYALAVVLGRNEAGNVTRQALLGDPYNCEGWGGMVEDLADPSRNVDDLGAGPSSDDAQQGALWFASQLQAHGYTLGVQ